MPATLTLVSHDLCPYVQRAAIALAEKGAAFERVTIDLAAKPEWFESISPLGKVPLLRVRDTDGSETILFESNVICEFVEETQAGPKLHPAGALQRAQHRAWMEFGSAILGDVWVLETTQDAAIFDLRRSMIADKFMRVEQALGQGPWFAGRTFSLVDAVFAPVFRYFDLFDRLTDLALWGATPRLNAWRAALAERPSVREAVTPRYQDLLHAFVQRQGAYILQRAA